MIYLASVLSSRFMVPTILTVHEEASSKKPTQDSCPQSFQCSIHTTAVVVAEDVQTTASEVVPQFLDCVNHHFPSLTHQEHHSTIDHHDGNCTINLISRLRCQRDDPYGASYRLHYPSNKIIFMGTPRDLSLWPWCMQCNERYHA